MVISGYDNSADNNLSYSPCRDHTPDHGRITKKKVFIFEFPWPCFLWVMKRSHATFALLVKVRSFYDYITRAGAYTTEQFGSVGSWFEDSITREADAVW